MRKPFVFLTMEASKTTSKTSSLKALLLKAWRERWTDLQWGINIKTVLPRGVSGDVYNLADCILQQAMVGCGANQLVISYLKHSLSAQLVSHAAVLQRIAKFDAFHKPHCVVSLLDFVEGVLDGVTCKGKLEEGILAASVLSLVHWLLQVYHFAISKYPSSIPTHSPYIELFDRPASLLNIIINSDFLISMLYLARLDDQEQYADVIKKCGEISSLIMMNTQFKANVPIEESLKKLGFLELDKFSPLNNSTEPVTFCLQALLAIELLANPNADTQVFVNELLMVKRIKGYTMGRLYYELMRACLISLNDVSGSPSKQSIWGAFTFLKVPQIIHQLHGAVRTPDEKMEYSPEIIESFELLLQATPLLDILDSKCSCNCVQSLLEGLLKLNLVSEQHLTYFSQKREITSTRLQKLEPTGLQGSIPTFIMRAEPTLAGILKTMSADFVKIQDALYSMLCQVLSGKSLEVILAVATVEGKLKQFVSKLIKFNECSLQVSGDIGKAPQRALLFDISFLILCSIVQHYGAEAVLEEGGESFFEQWVRDCMVEKGVPKSPDQMLQKCEPSKIDLLIRQLNSPDFDFKNSQMKCHDLCINVCGAIKEVLFAWEQGSLSATDVKRILDALKQKMASLAVCASAWLCSYMHIVHHDALLKPMNMVQQFLTPLSEVELAQSDNFKERSVLMFQIIRKMQYDVHPPTASKTKVLSLSHSIISKQPIAEQLQDVWDDVKDRGWLHIESTHIFESLLNTGGPVWFVTNLVKEILRFRYQEDLDRAVDLAFALFHLNIEQCTQALLLQVLPQYLYNSQQSEELVEPQASVLAKLCVYCIYAALEFSHSNPSAITTKKRGRYEDAEDIEALCPTNKVRRLNDNTAESSTLFASTLPNPGYNQKTIILKEPLQSALQDLFKTFSQLVGRDGEISPQTHFIFQFLVFMVQCGRDRARVVLQGMPSDLVATLVKSLPELFSTGLLLRLYDIGTLGGRKSTARDLCMLRNMQLRPN